MRKLNFLKPYIKKRDKPVPNCSPADTHAAVIRHAVLLSFIYFMIYFAFLSLTTVSGAA